MTIQSKLLETYDTIITIDNVDKAMEVVDNMTDEKLNELFTFINFMGDFTSF